MNTLKRIIKVILPVILCFLFLQCDDNHDEDTSKAFYMTIASERKDRSNVEETPASRYVYYVKYEHSDVWKTFAYEIQNFNYEEGYEYVIKVKEVDHKNPPQDAPSLEYFFLELISKERKDSDVTIN